MNMGYEDDELKPYQEVQPDLNDSKRIGKTGTCTKCQNFFFSFEPFKFFFYKSCMNCMNRTYFKKLSRKNAKTFTITNSFPKIQHSLTDFDAWFTIQKFCFVFSFTFSLQIFIF